MTKPTHWNDALAEALNVFEDAQYAARWLETPNVALGGAAPRDLLDTESGWQVVKRALAAVEYGHPL
ncbi:hypothetical protein C3942_16945 [Solimonas fluminis]|jgi:uncharacterized protein (DUF2384 family)|uniref:Antitoxin Xre/MbcA/ParS-like toxin-binding domain-containing protein n=1 Tax=Solimonas fluminis TaxID=2086571 RepID=A0A2S5TCQ9_9GAMM|nr:MbcA/ParS/Xre antitoxin family protein [Solimonas fluminis]PPE72736.1 hypothetical protein C3942_16945 [Solimonas fluminis]